MNWKAHIVWMLIAGAAGPLAAAAAQQDTNAPVKSVFIQPANPNEGRDPFYPNSMRPYQDATPAQHTVDLSAIQIKGFSEIAGHRYVIINNHTFAEGDEGDVLTKGGRVHLRCLAVGPRSVLVEVNGARQLLNSSDQ